MTVIIVISRFGLRWIISLCLSIQADLPRDWKRMNYRQRDLLQVMALSAPTRGDRKYN